MTSRRLALTQATGFAASLLLPLKAQAQLGSRWEARTGKAKDIAIGANGQVWILGDVPEQGGFQIFRRNGDQWRQMPGGLTTIAADPAGQAWGTNDAKAIYKFDGKRWQRQPGMAVNIAVGAEGSVFCLGAHAVDGNHELYEWSGSSWRRADSGGVKLAVDHKGQPWLVNATNQISRRERNQWIQVPGAARDIAIGANGAVWVIGTDQRGETGYGVHHWDGRQWLTIDGIATSIAVAPNGLPWVLNANHQIFERV